MSNPVSGPVCQAPTSLPDDATLEAAPPNLDSSMHVSKADGLLGNLGLYNVEINGHTQIMSQQDLEALRSCPAPASSAAQAGAPDLRSLGGAHPSAYAKPGAAAPQATGAAAPATPVQDARATEHPVVKQMLGVVQQVYSHARFAHIDAAGSDMQRAIVGQFVRLGEVVKGGPCAVNADREELFMLGAHVVAKQLNLEQPFAEAAARGSKDRQAHDARQVHMWGDGSISTKAQRADYLHRAEVQRMLQTLSNITGGLAGAIGYGIGGDRGSDIGAAVDGVVMAVGDPLRARAASQAPAASQRAPLEPIARRAPAPEGEPAHRLQPNAPFAAGLPKTGGPHIDAAAGARARSGNAPLAPSAEAKAGSAAVANVAASTPLPLLTEPVAGDTLRGGINWNPLRAPSLERYMPNAGNVPIAGAIEKKGVTTVDFLQLQANHGGRIFAATDLISGSHVSALTHELLSGPLSKGRNIVILTGRHGDTGGFDLGMKKTKFLMSDFMIAPAAKNIEILDATKLSPAQMQAVLQRGDDVILGWCHSENSRQVMNALGVNVRFAPF